MRRAWLLMMAGLSAVAFCVVARAADNSYTEIARGKHLVDAGDCAACHTEKGGRAFAGGRAIETPFGVIYSANLTPDPETGIGGWSEADFYRAMHLGVRPDGSHLYPAFPYPYFTKLSRDDVRAIRAYLNTMEPVKKPRQGPDLPWPLNHRVVMRGWDMLFFEPGTFQPNKDKSAEWNWGAYLVQGPGHCGACHTPKNILGGDKTDKPLSGGFIQNWFAPRIANSMREGTGSWSVDDIVEYLKTGRNRHSGAAGLMEEVVRDSTSKLPESDLHAIATYIKEVEGTQETKSSAPDPKMMAAGKAIYEDSCSGCHQANGKGVPRMFPPLEHDAVVQQHDPTTVLRVILEGARTATTARQPTPSQMPPYNWKLSNAQVAAVATYIRNSWGNAAEPVSADEVHSLREKLHEQRTVGMK